MPNKIKFYIDSNGKKVYTLKNTNENKPTKQAHYKFIKIKNAPNNKIQINKTVHRDSPVQYKKTKQLKKNVS